MHLALILTTGLIWLYAAARFVVALPMAPGARIAIAALLLVVAEYHSLLALAFGSFALVELPRPLLIAIGWAFGSLLLLSLLLLLRDVGGVLILAVARGAGRTWLASRGVSLAIGALAALLGLWGTWQGVKQPAIRRVAITVPGLPIAFDGLRVAQLTDLHANGLLPASWMRRVVARTNAARPDMIVITGDLQDGDPAIREKDVAPLAGLHAPEGVLAIAGNHEYYSDYARWMPIFRQLGLDVLENRHLLIQRAGATLAVAGITDRQARTFGQPAPDLARALEGIPPGTATILLSHRPDNARVSAAAGVALQLSGHTHGGQVLGLHWITQHFNQGFVSGRYRVGAMELYVSNGTGLWNGFVLRIGRPSEITLITLQSGPGTDGE